MGTYLFEVTFLYRLLYSNVLYLVVCRNLTQSRHETSGARRDGAGDSARW